MNKVPLSAPDRREQLWLRAQEDLGLTPGGPVNIGWLCADRQVIRGWGGKTALIHEAAAGEVREFSFLDLAEFTNGWAAFLETEGVHFGDRVAFLLDRVPELYIGILGVLKLGAVAQPLFSAFGEEALASRLIDSAAVAVITERRHLGKLRRIAGFLPRLKRVIVVDAGSTGGLPSGEVGFEMAGARRRDFTPAPTFAETPSLLHYTSGTTGQPKGVLHTHGSVSAQFLTARQVLDLKDDDVYWCTADPGWVTGTSYGIIGPWANGATQVVLNAGFASERWYETIQRHRVSVWYTAPTAIRMLMKDGLTVSRRFNLRSLRHICSVGEPLNPEAVVWGREAFGLDIHDTYWQTETGAMMIANQPGLPVKPGSMGKPFPAVEAAILNPRTFEPIRQPGSGGIIAIRPPWPSLMRHYWNNSPAYYLKFRNGWYLTGDRASVDDSGYFWFMGRDDDVINTAGHLVGPFEIESALLEHQAIAESAAVGKPDPVNHEIVKVFAVLRPGFQQSDELTLEIMNFVRRRLSPLAMPQAIEFVDCLPRTRSGKILRRVLRARERGEDPGDMSSLEED